MALAALDISHPGSVLSLGSPEYEYQATIPAPRAESKMPPGFCRGHGSTNPVIHRENYASRPHEEPRLPRFNRQEIFYCPLRPILSLCLLTGKAIALATASAANQPSNHSINFSRHPWQRGKRHDNPQQTSAGRFGQQTTEQAHDQRNRRLLEFQAA